MNNKETYARIKFIFERFIKKMNIEKQAKTYIKLSYYENIIFEEISNIFNGNITWGKTSEGYDFWYSINLLWQIELMRFCPNLVSHNNVYKNSCMRFLKYRDNGHPVYRKMEKILQHYFKNIKDE